MTSSKSGKSPMESPASRADRLARALKVNISRRKAQASGRNLRHDQKPDAVDPLSESGDAPRLDKKA
jgi:hypothetical protein